MLTTFLDLIGAAFLAAAAFFIWPPACLIVIGVAVLYASWKASR